MSRIGKKPVPVPSGVEVSLESLDLKIKGPKGELRVPMSDVLGVTVEESAVVVVRKAESKQAMAMHGLIRSLIANAVTGVTDGFSKRLNVYGVGFRAEVEGARLTLNIGYSHPVVYDAPEGVQLTTEAGSGGSQAGITVRGIDKQKVGQVAADIRDKRKPDPYKGKGVRYEN
jgi:large subunit ribosomal protein L6